MPSHSERVRRNYDPGGKVSDDAPAEPGDHWDPKPVDSVTPVDAGHNVPPPVEPDQVSQEQDGDA